MVTNYKFYIFIFTIYNLSIKYKWKDCEQHLLSFNIIYPFRNENNQPLLPPISYILYRLYKKKNYKRLVKSKADYFLLNIK